MAGRKSDFTLTKLDDLFSTQEQRDEEKLSKIRDIPLTEIDDFPDHPFKVRDDEDIYEQFEKSLSAKENADFLKNEYGWGGSYPVIIGAGIDEQHDGICNRADL